MIKDMHNLPSRRLCHAISQRAPCRQPDHRPATTAEAAEEAYSDHTSNEYSHRLHEEDVTHRMNISSIRYEYRKDGDKKKFDRAMKKEQERHDKVVKEIKSDYDSHAHHHHHRHCPLPPSIAIPFYRRSHAPVFI